MDDNGSPSGLHEYRWELGYQQFGSKVLDQGRHLHTKRDNKLEVKRLSYWLNIEYNPPLFKFCMKNQRPKSLVRLIFSLYRLLRHIQLLAGFVAAAAKREMSLMVVIRLSRGGAKKRPFYQIVVADQRKSRDGRFIERLGFYNPLAKGESETLRLNIDEFNNWVSKGAQPSERVAKLVKDYTKAQQAAA